MPAGKFLQVGVTDEYTRCEDIKDGMFIQNLMGIVKRVESIWINKLKTTIKAVIEVFDETNLYEPIVCHIWAPWLSLGGDLKPGNVIHLRHFSASVVEDRIILDGYCGSKNTGAFGFNNYGDDIEYIFWANEPVKTQRVYTPKFFERLKHLRRLISAVYGEMMRIDPDIGKLNEIAPEELGELFDEYGESSCLKLTNSLSTEQSKPSSSRTKMGKRSRSGRTSLNESRERDEHPGMRLLVHCNSFKNSRPLKFESVELNTYNIAHALGKTGVERPASYAPFDLLRPRLNKVIKISKLSDCLTNVRCNLAVQLIGYEVREKGTLVRVWDGTQPKFINLDIRDSFAPLPSNCSTALKRKAGRCFVDVLIPHRFKEVVELFRPGEFMVLIGVNRSSRYACEWSLNGNEGKGIYLLTKSIKLGQKLARQLDKAIETTNGRDLEPHGT